MKVYVIRHGHTVMNKKGLINGSIHDKLTPEGMEQAKTAAPALPKTIKHIYSSSRNRALQTANILNEVLKVPLTSHDELSEVNFGLLEGTIFTDEFKKIHFSQKYDWRPHGGESLEDVKKRVLKILKEIKKNTQNDGETLIVTHGGIIRLLTLLETGQVMDEIQNASLHSFDIDKILKNNVQQS